MQMSWDLDFISEKDFREHVKSTIEKYKEKMRDYNLIEFNRNIVDPIKLLFDKSVYHKTWEEIISSEIFRQRDKSSNNDIGYFHQNIFKYFKGCQVPNAGWDVIFKKPDGIQVYADGGKVQTIYVEMKNKHNTMNSSSSAKTYIKMQNQILNDDNCACFLVEVIAKESQNTIWRTKVDNQNVSHRLIRRVSIDQFYSIVTGDKYAFYKMCKVLPHIINDIIKEDNQIKEQNDTVIDDLKTQWNSVYSDLDYELAMTLSMYMLGFSSYLGFDRPINFIRR